MNIATLQTLHGRYTYKLTRLAQTEATQKPNMERGGEQEVPPQLKNVIDSLLREKESFSLRGSPL